MHRIAIGLLCACSSFDVEPPAQPLENSGLVVLVPDDASPAHVDTPSDAPVAPIRAAAPTRLWSGRHGFDIVELALSADGTAGVSVDSHDHARLWPSLDGTREPLVLPIAAPSQVVLHHDAEGFSIAALDFVGGLHVLASNTRDELDAHLLLAPDPPYASVVATDMGFIAVRTDHQLEWIDRGGNRRSQLAPQHGARIERLLRADQSTLALVETTDGIHGLWIEIVNNALAWGAKTPVFDIDPDSASISPDGAHLVGKRRKGRRLVLVDVDAGTTKPFAPRFMKPLDPFLRDNIPVGTTLGFAGNERVVFAEFEEIGVFGWYDLDAKEVASLRENLMYSFNAQDTMIAGDRVVAFTERELVMVTPSRLTYLGHRRSAARRLRASAAGPIANLGGSALLDEHLRLLRRIPAAAVPIDRDLALVKIGAGTTIDDDWLDVKKPRRRPVNRVVLSDLVSKREVQHWPKAGTASRVRYEPTTQMMVIDHGTKLEVARFDPVGRRFGASTFVRLPTDSTNIALTDPELANGVVAITIHRNEIRRWRTDHFETGTVPEAVALTRAPERIDRGGRLYLREDRDTVVIVAADRELQIRELDGWTLRPSPDGKHIAALARDRVKMLDGGGDLVWSTVMPRVAELAWTPDGKLIAGDGDLVELSIADGTIVYAQCGWSFALRNHRPEFSTIQETTCDR